MSKLDDFEWWLDGKTSIPLAAWISFLAILISVVNIVFVAFKEGWL